MNLKIEDLKATVFHTKFVNLSGEKNCSSFFVLSDKLRRVFDEKKKLIFISSSLKLMLWVLIIKL